MLSPATLAAFWICASASSAGAWSAAKPAARTALFRNFLAVGPVTSTSGLVAVGLVTAELVAVGLFSAGASLPPPSAASGQQGNGGHGAQRFHVTDGFHCTDPPLSASLLPKDQPQYCIQVN